MLKEKVLNTILKNELIKYGDTIVIGVSGGPDSITLLHLLQSFKKELGIKIIVCHINHMLREEAIEDEEYVKEYCIKENIPYYIKRESVQEVAKKQKIGTEEAGRKIRYSFFEEIAKKYNANKIATAHTANDNAETVLLNILRGTGVFGLRGIDPIRNERYIHPLIECTRKEIEEYCVENNLEAKIDKTNAQNIYTRNKVRNSLIPYIEKEFNPNIIQGINRLANIAREETKYIESNVIKVYEELLINEEKEIVLDLNKFNKVEEFLQKQIIRYSILKLLGTTDGIEKKHIEDIIVLCRRNIGNKFLIPNKNVKILVKNRKIFFIAYPKLP